MSVVSPKSPFEPPTLVVNKEKQDRGINTAKKNNDDTSITVSPQQKLSPLKNTPVNKELTENGHTKADGKDSIMSDEFNNTSYKLGKIGAELETHKAGQARLEASIAKLSEDIGNILYKVEQKIDDKFQITDAKLDSKLANFETKIANLETKIERSGKENTRWVIGIIITTLIFAINYFTSQLDKKIEALIDYNNTPRIIEQQQVPIATPQPEPQPAKKAQP